MAKQKLTDKQIKENKTNSIMKTVAFRAGYYRNNPQRFVEDYLQLNHKLKLFQKILLYAMFKNTMFLFVACRGLGKSLPT